MPGFLLSPHECNAWLALLNLQPLQLFKFSSFLNHWFQPENYRRTLFKTFHIEYVGFMLDKMSGALLKIHLNFETYSKYFLEKPPNFSAFPEINFHLFDVKTS